MDARVPSSERETAIRLEEVSVRFRIPHERVRSLKEYAIRALRNRITYEHFWAVRRVSGRRPVFGGVPGSTDGTILRTALGIPIVTFGPGNRLIPHQVDERVPIAELVEAARCYAAATLRFLATRD